MTSKTLVDFPGIISNFKFTGNFFDAVPYGFGHINDTYAVTFTNSDGSKYRYILQRINSSIFRSPEKLMDNIEKVTRHIKKKLSAKGEDFSRKTLNIIYTSDGKSFLKDAEERYWRSYDFIEGAKTYQIAENENHLYNAGKAFGNFQNLLSDFKADTLYEVIPDFHNTPKRYESFIEAVKADKFNCASGVKAEIDFIIERAKETGRIVELIESGKLPDRVTHNDTKFNNVMIDDETGEGICVVDLDTVMPGSSLYDFGDAIRSGTNPAEEDEKDLSKVCLNLNFFEKYTQGYLDATRDVLWDKEIELLPLGAKLMALECGMRFLTDHLNGNVYFKIHREAHNLDRCRTQLKMVEDMEQKWELMCETVKKCR